MHHRPQLVQLELEGALREWPSVRERSAVELAHPLREAAAPSGCPGGLSLAWCQRRCRHGRRGV